MSNLLRHYENYTVKTKPFGRRKCFGVCYLCKDLCVKVQKGSVR